MSEQDDKKNQEESKSMKVVDRRRFVLEDDGSVSAHPDAPKEMHKIAPKVPETQEPSSATSAPRSSQAPPTSSATPTREPTPAPASESAQEQKPPEQTEGVPFVHFLQQQAYMAMIYLGQQPNPSTGLVQAQPEGAREIVDVLLMLRSRTKGNLKREETQALNDLIHQLQLAYVQATSTPPDAGLNLKNKD